MHMHGMLLKLMIPGNLWMLLGQPDQLIRKQKRLDLTIQIHILFVTRKFFLNHFPKDTLWILTNKSKNDFVKLPLSTKIV